LKPSNERSHPDLFDRQFQTAIDVKAPAGNVQRALADLLLTLVEIDTDAEATSTPLKQ